MSIEEVKKISLVQILKNLGHNPIQLQTGGEELLYQSPLRKEKNPSFYVNTRKNLWNDFGFKGGSNLDFLMLYKNISLSEAIDYLNKTHSGDFKRDFKDKNRFYLKHQALNKKTLKIVKKIAFENAPSALIRYFTEERKIPLTIAAKHLHTIHFLNTGSNKEYFAAGFENSVGGFELRNPYFKGSIGGKAISLIGGTKNKKELLIFEGFINFLSRLAKDELVLPERDCLVLNSAIYINDAIDFIENSGYEKIFGFLDNDPKGEELSMNLEKRFANIFQDCRFIYKSHNDLNDYIKSL